MVVLRSTLRFASGSYGDVLPISVTTEDAPPWDSMRPQRLRLLPRGKPTRIATAVHQGCNSNPTLYTEFVANAIPDLNIKTSTRTLRSTYARHGKAKRCLDYLYGNALRIPLPQR